MDVTTVTGPVRLAPGATSTALLVLVVTPHRVDTPVIGARLPTVDTESTRPVNDHRAVNSITLRERGNAKVMHRATATPIMTTVIPPNAMKKNDTRLTEGVTMTDEQGRRTDLHRADMRKANTEGDISRPDSVRSRESRNTRSRYD